MRKVLPFAKRICSRLVNDGERGSSIIELAIIFPILLLLFVGVAELGRLFYTYTTLAKATKVGARFLSTEKDAEERTDAELIADVRERAARMVVCGNETSCTATDGTAKSIVPGLKTSDVVVTLPDTTPGFIGPRYVKVQVNFDYKPAIFNIAGATGSKSETFYFSLEPSTEMRYMH